MDLARGSVLVSEAVGITLTHAAKPRSRHGLASSPPHIIIGPMEPPTILFSDSKSAMIAIALVHDGITLASNI